MTKREHLVPGTDISGTVGRQWLRKDGTVTMHVTQADPVDNLETKRMIGVNYVPRGPIREVWLVRRKIGFS